MPQISALEAFTPEACKPDAEIAKLRQALTEGQKLRAIYDFASDLLGDVEYGADTYICDMMETLSSLHEAIEYCGLV